MPYSPASTELLVVAGEASGDALGAKVIAQLNTPSVGMGGPELAKAGTELVVAEPRLANLGPIAALGRVHLYHQAFRCLLAVAKARQPRVALLVGFSAFNARLGPRLMELGLQVLWYAPPQVWAWRPRRVFALAKSCHRVLLLFPFEPEIWSAAGVSAEYVGHPGIELGYESRARLRQALGWHPDSRALALLPGSRPGEVRRLLEPMLAALDRLEQRHSLNAAVLLSQALPLAEQRWVSSRCRARGVRVEAGTSSLPAFDVALAASGTVTLECVLAGVPPVVCYRTDPLTALIAAQLLETPHVALPNIVAGRRVFPELLQRQVTPDRLSSELERLLQNPAHFSAECHAIQSALALTSAEPPSARVASQVRAWLS